MSFKFFDENTNTLDLNDLLITNSSATFFFKISGNEMNDFGICDGDIVFVDRSINPNNQSLILCDKDGEFMIKKFGSIEELNFWGVITYAVHKF
jgi:DNA polymerase V